MKKEQKRGKMKIFLFIIAFFLVLTLSISVQATLYEQKGTIVHDAGKSTQTFNQSYLNLAAPEAIDYTKGLLVSIPIMNIPGRMIMPLTIHSRAGIEVKDEASWVGLGWDLGVGAITSNGTDYFSPFGRIIKTDAGGYESEEWTAADITYDSGNDKWKIINLEGNEYIYGKAAEVKPNPKFNITEKIQKHNSTGWFTTYEVDGSFDAYNYAWYLTEIHSNDYVDFNSNGIADDPDYGSWVKVDYKDPPELQNVSYRYPRHGYELYNISSDNNYDKILKYKAYDFFIDFTYIDKITTSSFIAYFVTNNSNRDDIQSVNRSGYGTDFNTVSPYSLDYIKFVEKENENWILAVVDFGYASGSNRLQGNKLTLKNITTYGACGANFEPATDPHFPTLKVSYNYNPEYNAYAYDLWGYYNGQTNNDNNIDPLSGLDNHEVDSSKVTAWSLTSIEWPSGSTTSYAYGSNQYTWLQNTDVNTAYGGGIKINSTTTDDGLGNTIVYEYSYGDGVATFIPVNETMYLTRSSIGRHSRIGVEYKDITVSLSGYGSVKEDSTTSYDYPDTTHSMDYKRGLIKSVYYKDNGEAVKKQIDNAWSFSELGGISDPYVSGIANLMNVNVTVDGLKTETGYEYESDNGLVDKIIEIGPDNRITTIEYAFESESGLENKNMLSQVDEVKTYKNNLGTLESKSKIVYANDFGSSSQWYPDYIREWINASESSDYTDVVNYVSYDNYGNLETYDDGKGNTVNIRYSSTYDYAFPTSGWNDEYGSEGDPAWTITYDNLGNVLTSTDENDQQVTYEYDKFSRLRNITYPGDSTPSIKYDYYYAEANGGLSSSNLNYIKTTSRLDGNTNLETVSYYDGEGKNHEILIEDGTTDIIYITKYNDIGLVDKEYKPFTNNGYYNIGNTPTTNYTGYVYSNDSLFRLNILDPPGSGSSSLAYGSSGNDYTSTVTDANSKSSTGYIDLLGNLVKATDMGGDDATATYNIQGDILTSTNQENQVETNTFDDLGRILNSNNVDSGTTNATYDNAGNPTSIDDEKNPAINYEYDYLNRLTKEDYPSGTDTTYTYDSYPGGAPSPVAGLDNPTGRLTSISDSSGTIYYYYDVEGRIGQTKKLIDDKYYNESFSYDSSDNLISIIDVYGREINYTYNNLNQITEIKVDGTTIATYEYNVEGQITYSQLGTSSLDINYTYDSKGRLESINADWNSADVLQRYYEYDDVGIVTAIHNATSPTNKLADYGVDDKYRLNGVTDYDYYGNNYNYTYDKIGNRLSKTIGSSTDNYIYYTGTNKLQSDGVYNYTYDANGNRVYKTNASSGEIMNYYGYDYQDRLIYVNFSDGTDIDYVYDSFGNLIKKIDRDNETIIFYGGILLNYNAGEGDTIYPIFSNYTDNNGTLTDSGTAEFNVFIKNTNGTAFLEINNNNYTASNYSVSGIKTYVPNSTNSEGWKGLDDTVPVTLLAELRDTAYTAAELNTTSADDANSVSIDGGGSAYPGHEFLFDITEAISDINNISIRLSTTGADSEPSIYLLGWNHTSGSFVTFDTDTCNSMGQGIRCNMTYLIKDPENFVNASGDLYITTEMSQDFVTSYVYYVEAIVDYSGFSNSEFNVSVFLTNGTYAYYWGSWGNGTNENYNFSVIRYYTVNTITDNNYPQFSNYWDDNSSIESSGIAHFNVTITSTNGSAFLEIKGANYPASNLTASTFNVSVDITSNGTFSYYWGSWGNGTNNNYNVSAIRYYTIKGDATYPSFSNYKDNNGTITISGIAKFNTTIENTNGTVFLEINGSNYTATNLIDHIYNVSVFLTNGTYPYYWGSWGNGTNNNYNTSEIMYYTVNTAKPQISLDIIYPTEKLYLLYGDVFNVTANVSCSDMNCGGINVTLDPEETEKYYNWEREGNVKTYYAGIRYAKDSDENWVDSSDVIYITKESDDITFHYNGEGGYKNLTMEAGVIYNGKYYSMKQVKQLKPEVEFNFPTKKYPTFHKYAVDITNIANLINNTEYITLTYKEHSGFSLSDLKFQKKRILAEIMELSFNDLLANNYTLKINETEKRIYIGNLKANYNQKSDSLHLDPLTTYYPSGTACMAWKRCDNEEVPDTLEPYYSEGDTETNYTGAELGIISVDDENNVTSGLCDIDYGGHRILFNIIEPAETIHNMTLTMRGWGVSPTEDTNFTYYNFTLYAWNNNSNSWGSALDKHESSSKDTVTANINDADIENYVYDYGSENYEAFYALVMGPKHHGQSNNVFLYYAELKVYHNMTTSKNGTVSTEPGTYPFWTNVSNPYNITLNINESKLVTWWVNATSYGGNYPFFAYANLTSDMSISSKSETFYVDVSIQ